MQPIQTNGRERRTQTIRRRVAIAICYVMIVSATLLSFGQTYSDDDVHVKRSDATLDARTQFISATHDVLDVADASTPIASASFLAKAILVNGEPVVYVKTEADGKAVLAALKARYNKPDTQLKSISFLEDVTIGKARVALKDFEGYKTHEAMLDYLAFGTETKRIYTVAAGDTVASIAKAHALSEADIYTANPQLLTKKYLSVGQVINVMAVKPIIHVKTVEAITYFAPVAYDTIKEKNKNMYEDESRVKRAGTEGVSEFHADLVVVNGVEQVRNITSERVVKAPVPQVLIVGTIKVPPKIGTGSFDRPARGYTITSPFGVRRSYGIHTGIDLAMPIGSTIKAADGGVVTFSGYRGTYGRLIIIDHGDRKSSYYAHCSKLLVKAGEKVFKGQKIALSGNTGRSTGPHLHFEIRVNNIPVNPVRFVGL